MFSSHSVTIHESTDEKKVGNYSFDAGGYIDLSVPLTTARVWVWISCTHSYLDCLSGHVRMVYKQEWQSHELKTLYVRGKACWKFIKCTFLLSWARKKCWSDLRGLMRRDILKFANVFSLQYVCTEFWSFSSSKK